MWVDVDAPVIPKVDNPTEIKDYIHIGLVVLQYKIIGKILANRLAKVVGEIMNLVQLTFIKGRYILDGILMVNEVIRWASIKKKKMMLFKVKFEKAYDLVSCDYLDFILDAMGFRMRWHGWIRGCLRSAKSSILINGNPTYEFQMFRGLRQGDPLFPFVFIIVMEGLNVCMEEGIHKLMYRGVTIEYLDLLISHWFYADDASFF